MTEAGENMSFNEIFVVAGFALSVGVFALALKGIERRWLVLIGLTTAVAFVSAGSMVVWEEHERSQHLQTVSAKILTVIGDGRRTTDEILENLFPENFDIVTESLGLLLKDEKVQNSVIETVDKAGLSHRVRVYFAKR